MNTAKNIKGILTEQISGYRELLYLLQRERECLVNLDAAGIQNISKEKDTLILRLKLLEEARMKFLKESSAEMNSDETITLQKLYDMTGDETLKSLRLQLISMLQSIQELNEFNSILIERSLGFVKNSIEFLKSSGANPKVSETSLSRKA